jgi:hypothetical protein
MTRKRRVERKVTAVHTNGHEAWQHFHNTVTGIGVVSFTPQPLYPMRMTPMCTVNKGLVDPGGHLDTSVNRKNFVPAEKTRKSSVVQHTT